MRCFTDAKRPGVQHPLHKVKIKAGGLETEEPHGHKSYRGEGDPQKNDVAKYVFRFWFLTIAPSVRIIQIVM